MPKAKTRRANTRPFRPFRGYRPLIRSRHGTHAPLRRGLERLPFRSVVRLGSIWPGDGRARVECNSVVGVRNSSDKLSMKNVFTDNQIPTAAWQTLDAFMHHPAFEYPVVVKNRFGSRGEGNYLIENSEELRNFTLGNTRRNTINYIVERFYSYSREYRLHVSDHGCFYACRKMLKHDAPENERWRRHDDNSVWVREENPLFDRPSNWNAIVQSCVDALAGLHLDVAAFDIKVQSARKRNGELRTEAPKYIIIESNSAPSFGEVTLQKYTEEIPKILKRKAAQQ